MKNQYIKFIEGNQESLDKACRLAEKHGYKKWGIIDTLKFEGKGVLYCDINGDYYTSSVNEEVLIRYGSTELKEESEWVYVSGISEEYALKDNEKRILISILPGKATYKYICVGKGDEEAYINGGGYDTYVWKYAVPVPTEEKKERKLMMTDSEWEKFQNIINQE